jgi:AcrR family transcriptional regulator
MLRHFQAKEREMARLAVLDKPAKPRSSAEDRAAEVLMTAADLIYRNGFDGTSMNDIAKAVNLTKAGLYYYTKGKDDLLFKIITFAMDCVDRDIVAPCREISDPELRLREIILHHLRVIFVTGGAITILTEEVNKLSAVQRRTIIHRKRQYLDLVRDTLRELKKSGRLRDMDITIAALNLFAAVLGVARWYQRKGRFSSDRVADETARFILAGLLKDK